jgi:hypothetical protein
VTPDVTAESFTEAEIGTASADFEAQISRVTTDFGGWPEAEIGRAAADFAEIIPAAGDWSGMDTGPGDGRFERLRQRLAEATEDDLRAAARALSPHLDRGAPAGPGRLAGEFWNLLADEWARRGAMLYILEEELDGGGSGPDSGAPRQP